MGRKIFLSFVWAMFIARMSFAQDVRCMDYPYYKESNTSTVEFTRIEAGKEQTVVCMNAYNLPNYWVRIASDSYLRGCTTGRKYKLLRSEGFELDKEVYMPANGCMVFKLFFEPLDKEDVSVDFMEGDAEGAFQIHGISLERPLTEGSVKCHLEGVVNDSTFSRMMLVESGADARTKGFISIPVYDGKFSYDFYTETGRYYELSPYIQYLNGSWRMSSFFTYDGTVNFVIGEEGKNSTVSSAYKEQKAMEKFISAQKEVFQPLLDKLNEREEELVRAGNCYVPEYDVMMEKLSKASGEEKDSLFKVFYATNYYTEAANELRKEYEELSERRSDFQIEYLKKNPSLYGLVYIEDRFPGSGRKIPEAQMEKLIKLYDDVYSKLYKGSVYHERINVNRTAYLLSPGKPYIDYELRGEDGKMLKISSLIKGHMAIIDLWASWCGPCRRHSISFIPLYEKYKDKGLVVVSIARERNAEDMVKAVKRDGYPWKSYLELKDENRIWYKNGIGNAGGGVFLIDADGTILLVNPDACEIENVLKNKLGE